MANKAKEKVFARRRRQRRVRKKVVGSTERPRLCVFRSSKHIYAQVIDDTRGVTLASASTVDNGFESADDDKKVDRSRKVGQLIAARCKDAGVENVVFDRNGYRYTSMRVKALAEGAREGGLNF